jgi:GntR family transcriptional repressor for pyruvate dehydrogenase complex
MTPATAFGSVEPIVNGRISQLVVEQLQAMIRAGTIAPGDRLPPERSLAEMFGVGRNSVREALRELEVLGLVERRRGQGTHVRSADPQEMMAPLRSVISLSGTLVDQVIEFRRTFEPQVSALAATKLNPSSVAVLNDAFQAYTRALSTRGSTTSAESSARADANFHRAIALATGNPIVIALHDALDELLVDFRAHLVTTSGPAARRVAKGHREILDAILAADPEAARTATTEHLGAVDAVVPRRS